MKNIYQTINAVMADIGAIKKEQVNRQQQFHYRGVDDVMNALNPAFIRHNLFVVPEVLEQTREERQTIKGGNLIYSVCKVKYTFYAEDGSYIAPVVIGEGMDSGDKASNKALSVAFKYACFQVFCIPTEELKDPDAETPERNRPAAPQQEQIQGRNRKQQEPLGENYINSLLFELDRTGVSKSSMLKTYHAGDIRELTIQQYKDAMTKLGRMPSMPSPEELSDAGLPWETPKRR